MAIRNYITDFNTHCPVMCCLLLRIDMETLFARDFPKDSLYRADLIPLFLRTWRTEFFLLKLAKRITIRAFCCREILSRHTI